MHNTPTILIANRGEIAARIIRTAQAHGMRTVAIRSSDEEALGGAAGLHVQLADEVMTLPGRGAAAYLDAQAVLEAACSTGAQLVHPGYGFLAESPQMARLCEEAGITWIGPSAEVLKLFGDKQATRDHAASLGIPVPASTGLLSTAKDEYEEAVSAAADLLAEHAGGIAIKAVAGGGGRGIRMVHDPDKLQEALEACAAEAQAGFGDDRVFAEAIVTGARHIEVQVLGTSDGAHVLGDRDCSIQRRRQKLVEIAPAPGLSDELRASLHADAARLTVSGGYVSLATVEFLASDDRYELLEVNPRIQVEHTVTEQVTGLDLVACQLDVATGKQPLTLDGDPVVAPEPRGYAIQLRVAAESMQTSGEPMPSAGTVDAVTWPTGPGVRVDTWVQPGTTVNGAFDSLLGKIIVQGPILETALSAADRALCETRIAGIETNVALLQAIGQILDPGNETTTSFDARAADIVNCANEIEAARQARNPAVPVATASNSHSSPLSGNGVVEPNLRSGETLLRASLTGTVVSVGEKPSEYVVIEAMKMHHPVSGAVAQSIRHLVSVGDFVSAGTPLAVLSGVADQNEDAALEVEPHPGVAEVQERHAAVLDEAREKHLTKIRDRGRRTARENVADLVDPGSFVEYGPLAIAAQTKRRSLEDLIEKTSGDALVGGVATIEGQEVVVISYDYSVLAGTQGTRNHAKVDRLIQVAIERQVPLILFAEGGGGRPGETDRAPSVGLSVPTFADLAALRGQVPMIAVVSGYTFAGNAALAGVCDLIIATPEVNLGMGGPAMIEGGGLGKYRPEDIGPAELHMANGVIDILAQDEAEAVAYVKETLSMLTGTRRSQQDDNMAPSDVDDELAETARTVVPAERLRAFSMVDAITSVVDPGTFTEVRQEFGAGAITGFGRIDGKPLAIIANNNHHLGGAIDVEAARTMTQHLTLAQDHGLPVVSFVDTPGFMVGVEAEREPGVRAFGDLFVAGASLTVPVGAVVIRKAYGLGAMAMLAGSSKSPQFTISWPSGELGPMGLEGAVRLGYAKELAAIEDPAAREAKEAELTDQLYEQGRAMSAAMIFEIDDVIDPALTRDWLRTLV